MTVIWTVLLLTGGAMVVLVLTSWRHRVDMAELGTMSQQWLAEERACHRDYSKW